MTSSGGSWRVAGRLARREVRRHPWRHLLVVGLILVPVLAALAAFSGIATWQDTDDRSDRYAFPDDEIIRTDGLQRTDQTPGPVDASSARSFFDLPPDVPVELSWRGADWLIGAQQRPDGNGPQLVGTEVYETPAGSIEADRFVVEDGRLPRTADEVFLTAPAAAAGSWAIGDTVTSARTERTFEVVGTGVLGEATDRQAAAVRGLPDSFWGGNLTGVDAIDVGDERISPEAQRQATLRVSDDRLRQDLLAGGFVHRSGATTIDSRVRPALTMAAAAICAVVAIVASAALAISSRRQLRTIGLLSTVGTDPSTIRRSMLLQGAIPGLVAGIGAVAIAIAATWIANQADLLERFSHVAGAQIAISPVGAAVAVTLGIASGTLAAWQPARTSSRLPTLSALAGRRPVGSVPSSVPIAGAVAWVAGACLLLVAFGSGRRSADDGSAPFLIIGGIAALALGTVGLTPAIVALLEPLAGRFRGTWRMGLRGLARHRMQSAATVAAVAVVLAIPVGLLVTRDGMRDRAAARNPTDCCLVIDGSDQRPTNSIVRSAEARLSISGALRSEAAREAVDSVRDVLGPSAAVVRTIPIVDQDGAWQKVAIIDEDRAAEVLVPRAAQAIAAGKAIARDRSADEVAFTAAGDTARFAVADEPGNFAYELGAGDARYLVGAAALGDVGAERPADSIAVVRPTPLDDQERQDLAELSRRWESDALVTDPTLADVQAAVAGGGYAGHGVYITNESEGFLGDAGAIVRDPNEATDRAWDRALLAMAVASGIVALLVLTITLSLRAVDGEADRRAAFAAGVAPASLRRQRAFEGLVLALLGAAVAVPLGWIPVLAAQLGSDEIDGTARYGAVAWSATPGWVLIPILLAPAVAAAVLWTVVPAIVAAVRTARHRDLPDDLIPRF